MVSTASNGRQDRIEDGDGADVRLVWRIPEALTPDDVVRRLIGLGAPAHTAQQLAEHHGEPRLADALDAFEVLDAERRILDPIGWVDAAVQQGWDLTGVLAQRREQERRLRAVDTDRHSLWRAAVGQ